MTEAGDQDARGRSSTPWLLSRLLQSSQTHGLLIAGSILVIKVLAVAEGDLLTALGILQASETAEVVTGVALLAVPVAAGLGVAYLAFGLGRGARGRGGVTVVVITVITAVLVTPWPVLLACLLPLLAGRMIRRVPPRLRVRTAWVCILLVLVPVARDVVTQPWLPRETLALRQGQPVLGYVLATDQNWVTVLTSVDRRLLRLRPPEVRDRSLCRRENNHESLYQFGLRRFGDDGSFKLPRCVNYYG